MSTRLTPSEDFPDDLTALDLTEVEVLNSRIHRELDHEYAQDGAASLETEIRHEEVTEELDRRDQQPGSAFPHPDLEASRQYS